METLTADQFKQKYGVIAASKFGQEDKQGGVFQEIKDAFAGGINKVGQGAQDITSGPGLSGLVPGVGKVAGGATEALTSPAAPLLNRTVGKAINWVADKASNIPGLQKFAMSPAGEATAKTAETFSNYGEAAGLAAGIKGVKVAGKTTAELASKAELPDFSGSMPDFSAAAGGIKGAFRDVIPNKQNIIDSSLAKALDLTQGDLRSIKDSTGNEVGQWLSANNLIGANKETTTGLIKSFFDQNYKEVRSQIDSVKTVYEPSQIPYFSDVLKSLNSETTGKIGLEDTAKETTNLLKKKSVNLADVQRVKELLDEEYSLYNRSGEVKSAREGRGLAKARTQIKDFIEKEVKDNTGEDIGQMNNDVATARSLADAIDARSQRGLTRNHLTSRDIVTGMGLTYFASPLVGASYILVQKLIQSPSIRLRVARYLDGLNDAERMKVSEDIKNGKVPPEVERAVNGSQK